MRKHPPTEVQLVGVCLEFHRGHKSLEKCTKNKVESAMNRMFIKDEPKFCSHFYKLDDPKQQSH